MIHFRNTAIADATVMRSRWFEGLALRAHGQFGVLSSLKFRGHGARWDTSGVRQTGLGVRRQRQGR